MSKDDKSAAELVERILAGNTRAEEELVARYSRGVSHVISANGGQLEVEDLCQKTFKLALEKLRRGELREPEKLSGFILALARNLSLDHIRRSRSKKETEIEEARSVADSAPNPFDRLLQKENEQLIWQAINRLKSPRDREILIQSYLAPENKAQIRVKFGLTNTQYNLALFRARKRCREIYERLIRRSLSKPESGD